MKLAETPAASVTEAEFDADKVYRSEPAYTSHLVFTLAVKAKSAAEACKALSEVTKSHVEVSRGGSAEWSRPSVLTDLGWNR